MSDPLTIAAIMGGASIASNLIGGSQTNKQAKRAEAAARAIYDERMAKLAALNIPTIEAQKIVLQDPELAGILAPQLEAQAEQLESQLAGIEVDPRLKRAQMDALSSIQERTTGLTPEDIIQIQNTRRDIAGDMRAQDANIVQNLEQRGLGGAGIEVAMRQAGGQRAQSQASDEADRLAQMQYNAKMGALQQAGSMAGQLRGQEFGEKQTTASAADAIAQFNLANRMGVSGRNIDRANQAQAGNLAQKQRLVDIRAGNTNQAEIHNKGLIQQDFQNKLQIEGIRGGVATNQANLAMQTGANQVANTSGMWGGISDVFSGAGKAYLDYTKPEKK